MAKLTELLSTGNPAGPGCADRRQAVRWLLAQLFELASALRQTRVAGRLSIRGMNDEIADERVGLTRMSFVERVESVAGADGSLFFEPQRSNVRAGKKLYTGRKFGEWLNDRSGKGRGGIKKPKKP